MSKKKKKTPQRKNLGTPSLDKIANLITGQGTSRDRAVHTRVSAPILLTDEQLQALYVDNWAFGKIVDMVAKDMIRPWRTLITKNPETTAKYAGVEKKFGLRKKILQLVTQARMQGTAIILLGGGNVEEAIDVESFKPDYIQVLSKDQMTINSGSGNIIEDPSDPNYGYPEFYTLKHNNSRIHVTRTIRYDSTELPFNTRKTWTGWWGLSELQRAWDALKDDASVAAALSQMATEMNLDIVSIENLVSLTSTQKGRDDIKARFSAHADLKTLYNLIVKDARESFDRKSISFTGTQDLSETFMNRLSAATGIPLTKFYGTSAKGMNSTGEGDEDDYDEMVKNEIELKVRPVLEQLDPFLARTSGLDENIEFVWKPLKLPSEENIANVQKIKMEAAKAAAESGVWTPDEIKKAFKFDVLN